MRRRCLPGLPVLKGRRRRAGRPKGRAAAAAVRRLWRMKIDLGNRVAIVTGAGGGIGRAACLAAGDAGAKILAVDLDAEKAGETADLVKQAGGEARVFRADVTRAAEVAAYV